MSFIQSPPLHRHIYQIAKVFFFSFDRGAKTTQVSTNDFMLGPGHSLYIGYTVLAEKFSARFCTT